MKPTQEQVIAWALKCGASIKTDCNGNGAFGSGVDLNALATLVHEAGYEAGRKDENEACAKVCDEQEQRSRESSEKSKRERDRFMYHHCAVTAKWNAATIRARREQ